MQAGRLTARSRSTAFQKGFLKSLEIFNLHRVLKTRIRSAIVVEGFFDAVNVLQSGFQNVVALMGSTLTAAQERLLVQSFDEVTLMLDGDKAGREATAKIADQLAGKLKVAIVNVPPGTQPDQLTAPEIADLLQAKRGRTGVQVIGHQDIETRQGAEPMAISQQER